MSPENMNSREDDKWQKLLLHSAPTFAGETQPPYGFVTGTLAQLRAENRQVAEIEKIGWRAVLASLGALLIAATVTVGIDYRDRGGDFEPGVRSMVQMENIQVS